MSTKRLLAAAATNPDLLAACQTHTTANVPLTDTAHPDTLARLANDRHYQLAIANHRNTTPATLAQLRTSANAKVRSAALRAQLHRAHRTPAAYAHIIIDLDTLTATEANSIIGDLTDNLVAVLESNPDLLYALSKSTGNARTDREYRVVEHLITSNNLPLLAQLNRISSTPWQLSAANYRHLAALIQRDPTNTTTYTHIKDLLTTYLPAQLPAAAILENLLPDDLHHCPPDYLNLIDTYYSTRLRTYTCTPELTDTTMLVTLSSITVDDAAAVLNARAWVRSAPVPDLIAAAAEHPDQLEQSLRNLLRYNPAHRHTDIVTAATTLATTAHLHRYTPTQMYTTLLRIVRQYAPEHVHAQLDRTGAPILEQLTPWVLPISELDHYITGHLTGLTHAQLGHVITLADTFTGTWPELIDTAVTLASDTT